MKIWVVKTGEPLPLDPTRRLFRTGMLAQYLADAGHEVTFWSGTFDHRLKIHHANEHRTVELGKNLRLAMIHSPGYKRHVSLARLRDHRVVGREFIRIAKSGREVPDIIHCGYPTIDLSLAAVHLAQQFGVPAVLDVRDMWPHVFADVLPASLRPIGDILLWPEYRRARSALQRASALTAHSAGYLDFALKMAGRAAGALDRFFPFAYDDRPASASELAEAAQYWRAQGVYEDDGWCNIAYFGSMTSENPHQDVETPLRAAELLWKQGRRIRLIYCGAGLFEQQLRERYPNMPWIIVAGYQQRPRIHKLMALSRAGLIPYRKTAYFSLSIPNKAVEYLAGGLGVITCLTHGELHDILREADCGFFYSEDDPVQCSDAMIRAASDPMLGARARTLFDAKFDPGSICKAMEEHLIQVSSDFKRRMGI